MIFDRCLSIGWSLGAILRLCVRGVLQLRPGIFLDPTASSPSGHHALFDSAHLLLLLLQLRNTGVYSGLFVIFVRLACKGSVDLNVCHVLLHPFVHHRLKHVVHEVVHKLAEVDLSILQNRTSKGNEQMSATIE